MAHDGEKEKHLEDVDEDENAEEDIEAGERQVGEDADIVTVFGSEFVMQL